MCIVSSLFFLVPKFRFVLVFNAIVFERSRTKRKKYIFLPKCTLFSCYALRPYPDSVHYFSSSLLFRLSNNLQHSFDCWSDKNSKYSIWRGTMCEQMPKIFLFNCKRCVNTTVKPFSNCIFIFDIHNSAFNLRFVWFSHFVTQTADEYEPGFFWYDRTFLSKLLVRE